MRALSTHPGIAIVGLILAVLAGACRGDGPGEQAPVEVDVNVAPTPALVGPARVVLAVRDSVGRPLEGARVRIEATMDHPGMVPVRDSAQDRGEGRYVVPTFEFDMSGDWILFIRVGLPDGRESVHEHRVRVVSPPSPDAGD